MNSYLNRDAHKPYGKVAVLMGGTSAEREISLKTGQAVHEALLRKGVDAHTIDVGKSVVDLLVAGSFDRAFIALHGRGGEDGVMQGMLETLGIPYTGSGVLGSALAMDKTRSKCLWQQAGLLTPEFVEIDDEKDLALAEKEVGFPMMIKPVQEGSSCGATKVTDSSRLHEAWSEAYKFDARVMAERWVEGTEYTVGILGRQTLAAIRLETPREFYDYEAKYMDSMTQYICPCGLKEEQEAELAAISLRAFELVDARGWGRVDLMQDNSGKNWLIEVNTIPGMTDHSLVPMAARQAGIEFDDLVIRILDTSVDELEIEERLVS